MTQMTATEVFQSFRTLPLSERAKFLLLVAEGTMQGENYTHEEVFGDLVEAEFSSQEAADYLDVSMSTFRRYVSDGKISASSEVGRSHLYSAKDLKAFKRSLKEVKGS